jgi:hypothetical protein
VEGVNKMALEPAYLRDSFAARSQRGAADVVRLCRAALSARVASVSLPTHLDGGRIRNAQNYLLISQ